MPRARRTQDRRKEHEALVRGPQWQACHALPCYACGAEPAAGGINEAHHEPPVSVGGTDADCIPLCAACHRRRHQIGGARFWGELELDPEDGKQGVRAYMLAPEARYRGHVRTSGGDDV